MRNFVTNDWLTGLIFLSLVCVCFARYSNTIRFRLFLEIILSPRYLKIYSKNLRYFNRFDILLFLNLVFSLAIFVYFILFSLLNFDIFLFLKLLIVITFFIISKLFLEYFISLVFKINKLVGYYIFQKITFKNYSGLFFFIGNLLLVYTTKITNIVIITILSLVFLINCIGFVRFFKSFQKLINPHFFYFLLYLCALEIVPYIILYKVFIDYNA